MPDDFGQISIGVLHPGSMGAAVGGSAVAAGRRVVWTSEDRSDATVERAREFGLEDVSWLNGVVNQSDIILSICPPHAALQVAQDVRDLGFQGIYVDANAISPETTRQVGAIVEQVGASFVDGGIVGGPPVQPGTTRLYLSGEEAPRVARLLDGGPLDVIVLDAPAGAASALKMCYAAWTKGTSALLTDILALASHEQVLEALQQEWAGSQPGMDRRAAALSGAAAKAWRWVAEMEEIAATFEKAGLPGDFHHGAAEVYRRLEQFKDDPNAPGGAELAQHLLPRPVER
jgi:3-hydroxyisobutyrate dehydrogenase-like beta-hydroxyacid dehydrogenase